MPGGALRLQVQQLMGRSFVERSQGEHRHMTVESRKVIAATGTDQHGDRFTFQPSGNEGQRIQGSTIEPLRIVQHHEHGMVVAQA